MIYTAVASGICLEDLLLLFRMVELSGMLAFSMTQGFALPLTDPPPTYFRIDNKYFSFFFPHGESSPAQGLIRFICGARVSEFPDRKANPRLLLESQCEILTPAVSSATY